MCNRLNAAKCNLEIWTASLPGYVHTKIYVTHILNDLQITWLHRQHINVLHLILVETNDITKKKALTCWLL